MYQRIMPQQTDSIPVVKRLTDLSFIIIESTSEPYQQFKKDIQNGLVLNDAEGNPITGSDLTTFIGTLP